MSKHFTAVISCHNYGGFPLSFRKDFESAIDAAMYISWQIEFYDLDGRQSGKPEDFEWSIWDNELDDLYDGSPAGECSWLFDM